MEQGGDHRGETVLKHLGTCEAEAEPWFPDSQAPPLASAYCGSSGYRALGQRVQFNSASKIFPSPNLSWQGCLTLWSELGMCRFVQKNSFIQQKTTVPCTELPAGELSPPLSPKPAASWGRQEPVCGGSWKGLGLPQRLRVDTGSTRAFSFPSFPLVLLPRPLAVRPADLASSLSLQSPKPMFQPHRTTWGSLYRPPVY